MKDAKDRVARALSFLAMVSIFVLLYWLVLDGGEKSRGRLPRLEVKRP